MALATYCFLNAWLHCNSTVVALLLQVEISRQRCVQNVWKSTTTESGIVKLLQPQKVVPKTTIEFLASSKAKKQKCCSDGRRIDTNVHLGRG